MKTIIAISRDCERAAYYACGVAWFGPNWIYVLAAGTWCLSLALLYLGRSKEHAQRAADVQIVRGAMGSYSSLPLFAAALKRLSGE